MKVLFAIGNAQTSKSVADKYFQLNGEQLDYKDVFYFRALLEEVRRDKTYDRIVISEELEPIKAVTIEEIDQTIFSNIDNITDEIQDSAIAFIGSDRRTKNDALISRLFNIGVYSLLLGNDRNISSLCEVIKEPRTKKDAKEYLNLNPAVSSSANSQGSQDDEITESQMAHILKHYEKLGNDTSKYISSFESIEEQFNKKQLVIIAAAISKYLPSIVSETISKDPRYAPIFGAVSGKVKSNNANTQKHTPKKAGILNFLSSKKDKSSEKSNAVVQEGARIQAEEEARAREAAEKAEAESKRLREEAERASRLQAEQLRKEKEERLAKAELELKQKQEEEQKAKAEADRLAKEQEELKQRAIAEQKAKAEADRLAKEQEELRQRAIAEQKAKAEADKFAKEQEELRRKGLAEQKAKEDAAKQNVKPTGNVIGEIEIDISALQNKPVTPKTSEIDEQEALKQKAIAEQKAREEQAQKQAQEQEALRQKALAEQKAREEQAQKQAQEQEALRQKALAEQKAREEQAQKQAQEQEALRQKALAEQKAREEAARLAREQEELRIKLEAERAAIDAINNENVTTIETPTANSALLSTNGESGPLESNFSTATYQLPSDYKKIVAIVGTNKVGTTFIANAIANSTSEKGIKTALLDMTKSKGLYYLYNKSDQKRIQLAAECIKNLNEGRNTPLPADKNKNLLVYTSLPGLGENRKNYKHKTIIDTIKRTCNLLIIDCDFTTPIEYFEQASEIYIVQDMDLIKLQETTAFLREFKNRNIDWSKLNVIINKYVKSSFTPKKIVEVGLAYYNDPQMTYTEEFETIKSYITIPFTLEDYARYTEDVAKDKIIYKNYSIQLRSAIDQICKKIYPSGNLGKKKGLFK